MTITLGVLMLIIVFLAVKMRGAQIPHVILGVLLMKATTPESIVDVLAQSGLNVVNAVINALATAAGQGNIV